MKKQVFPQIKFEFDLPYPFFFVYNDIDSSQEDNLIGKAAAYRFVWRIF